MRLLFRHILAVLPVSLLCQCGAPAPPSCRIVPTASRVPAAGLVSTARDAWIVLGNSSRKAEWLRAKMDYNAAVAKLFDQLACGKSDWQSKAAALGTAIAGPSTGIIDPGSIDALFPAASVKTKIVGERHRSEGLGVELVGWTKTTPLGEARPKFQLPTGIPTIVNGTLRFDAPGKPVWYFTTPTPGNQLPVGTATQPLAMDWSAPNAFYWKMSDLDDLLIQNVFLPDRYMDEIGLYFTEPYDPKKIPLVMIHGVNSSPDAFKFIMNDLMPEPWFRERYQIWLFNYPTGNPWIYTGARFRESIHEAVKYARTKGGGRSLDQMVIFSHSMGGLITRSSVTDPGGRFYNAHFKKPLNQLNLSTEYRKLVQDTTLYQPLTEPKRVVFMAVPHRGSPLADLRIALMASNFVRLPKMFTVDLADSALSSALNTALPGKPFRAPTSISSLSPNNRDIIELSKMPLPKRIKFHSIIGNRGKGVIPDCSDGVVAYPSSHVTPVESELMVPWVHGVTDCPQTGEELKRILKLHLSSRP